MDNDKNKKKEHGQEQDQNNTTKVMDEKTEEKNKEADKIGNFEK